VQENHVLLPDASGTRLLTVPEGAGVRLPTVATEQSFRARAVVDELRRSWGLEAAYLRTGRPVETREPDGRVLVLREFDAAPDTWSPPPPAEWLPLAVADAATLAPVELRAGVERWLAEQTGQARPPQRAPWARPGWSAQAEAWVSDTLASLSIDAQGPLTLFAQWPLSSILRIETSAGALYLKAVFSLFHHEPAVTEALTRTHPGRVPDVLAVDDVQGWMLMRELTGRALGDLESPQWSSGLRAAAEIQRAWIGRGDELLRLGAQDRTLAQLADQIGTLAELSWSNDEERARVERAVPELRHRCRRLAELSIPETIVHGDLHPWNVREDRGRTVIFDWSDACLAHPFFDLQTFVEHVDDERETAELVDRYLEAWTDAVPLGSLREAYELSRPLAQVHHAVSYVLIVAAFEPEDRWLFADEPRRRALDAVRLVENLEA
jgi:Phosphotransferase enzyme family